jgi:molybdopterin-containing oxidoreductase family iron-sulfur binding subunit
MDRREFLKKAGMFLASASCGICVAAGGCNSMDARDTNPLAKRRWGMVIDLNKCQSDCTLCMDACRHENNVAFHGDKRWDIHWIRKVKVKDPEISSEKSVLLLCNHCDDPPCAQVCPVQATYRREDGIVVVDHHRCIGCRYCMIACPYNARYFNYKENHEWPNKNYPKRSHGVAESCTFCAHLLDSGRPAACVDACSKAGFEALVLGDLNDPNSEVSKLISSRPVKRIREDFGTKPKVYYLGL